MRFIDRFSNSISTIFNDFLTSMTSEFEGENYHELKREDTFQEIKGWMDELSKNLIEVLSSIECEGVKSYDFPYKPDSETKFTNRNVLDLQKNAAYRFLFEKGQICGLIFHPISPVGCDDDTVSEQGFTGLTVSVDERRHKNKTLKDIARAYLVKQKEIPIVAPEVQIK